MTSNIKKKTKLLTILMVISLILILTLAFMCLFPALYIGGAFEAPMTPKIAQLDYNKYSKEFNAVVQYILNNEINDFYINENDDIDISDKDTYKALITLIKVGYNPIGITKNTLYFQKYATLDCGKGIMYSIDGKLPYMQFLTDTKELSVENWYYYEDDYNKWRAEHN